MSYAALISLHETLDRLLNSRRTVLVNSCREFTQVLKEEVASTKETVKKLKSNTKINRTRINGLDEQIREAVHKFEDTLEFHVSNQLLPQYSEEEEKFGDRIRLDLDLHIEELKQDFDSFTQELKKMKDAYGHELSNFLSEEEDDDDDDVIHLSRPGGDESEMVGLSDQFIHTRNSLTTKLFKVTAFFGMAGIGKTSLAKKIFRDPLVSTHFTKRAFVTVGPNYKLKRILLRILKQVMDDMVVMEGQELSLDRLRDMISQISNKNDKFLVVLDDVWDEKLWSYLVDSFPRIKVFVTTRVKEIMDSCPFYDIALINIRFLDKKESWDLFRKKVFGDESKCSYELEEAGKKIAERCEGLPLTIITVAEILSRSDDKQTAKYWNKIAANVRHSVFVDAYDQMHKVLYPSYEYLNQELKACFLYMGVFPQTYEIPSSKLKEMWVVEGLCPGNEFDFTLRHLRLCSVVLDRKTTTCCLSSPVWHMCNKEATKIKFFRGLDILDDILAKEDLKSQRRLCVRNNVLFGIEDIYDSMASVEISTVRSLLCTGPYHQYPVPICLEYLRLLRILDALNVRFYEFPMEVVNLAQLVYLALTLDENIPPSIFKLWNLQYLIVHPHLSIIEPDGISSYLPMEIWDMKFLNHLQVVGGKLPIPRENSLLENLSTLLDVSPQSCTEYNLTRIPNLKKLGIRIELGPDYTEPLTCFDHISHLTKLETLECVIANPRITSEVGVLVPLSIFPSSLEKLTLTGNFGYPWEEMSKISSLPNLRELILQCYAFRGPKWRVEQREFPKLRVLSIEETDLVQWTFGHRQCLKNLDTLSMKHCYRLQEIPHELGRDYREMHIKKESRRKIELVDCNPVALACVNKLVKALSRVASSRLVLDIHSSWDDA